MTRYPPTRGRSLAHVRRLTVLIAFLLAAVMLPCRGGEPASPDPAGSAAPLADALSGEAAPVEGSAVAAPVFEEEIIGSVTTMERLEQGGKTMWFLLGLSVITVTFALERAFRLRRGVIAPSGLSEEAMSLWRDGKFDDLLLRSRESRSTLGAIIEAFVRHRHCSSLELSMLASDVAGRDMRGHLQRAYPIAVVATLSPLLGLLGTVFGMIESFEVVAIAGSLGDASLLAGGISKALVTTAAGLVIAVPSLGLYHLFRSRTNALTMVLEGEVNELLTAWFMERPGDAEEDSHAG